MNEVMDRNSLVQIIEEPTREKNTLDLVYTNEAFDKVNHNILIQKFTSPKTPKKDSKNISNNLNFITHLSFLIHTSSKAKIEIALNLKH